MSSLKHLPRRPRIKAFLAGTCALALAACGDGADFDLRGPIGGFDTADVARTATADRPKADSRGIISYPGYQVAVAKRGDTLGALAARIGVDANELARYNGIQTNDTLRKGEIIALPGRVSEPIGGPIGSDITQVAGAAIDSASSSHIETSTLSPAASPASAQQKPAGVEPVRHQVARGETAYTIARLYNVSIRSLADWNGLGADFSVREGQYLIIPVALPGQKTAAFDASDNPTTEAPGVGSPTPEPPSANKPLPPEDTVPAAKAAQEKPKDAPDLGQQQTAASTPKARMSYPVRGDIVRPFSKGKNDGIDIAASPGTAVKAADGGVIAAITKDTKGTPIIVIKHANNLLTVYSNVDNVAVKTGDQVSRGQALAKIPSSGAAAVHFEVRDGFDSLDPIPYLTE